ncbi:hypothetical protein FQN60_014567, partial [Etheostoma spectabile]
MKRAKRVSHPPLAALHVALFARFFTLLPQLSWQRIPPAPGSHRTHKLIRHLLESSADRETRRIKANICSSYPVWEDFSAKATKLHSQLRTTILAAVAFLDAFQ